MYIEFAPMEGITGYIFRNAFAKYFGGVERYYSPFLSPAQNKAMTYREKMDVLPEHNQNITLIPQILTNVLEYFLETSHMLANMGYTEVNLNLGCPSATVVTKGKGAGMLFNLDQLHFFLEKIFTDSPINISVKTRLGMINPEEIFPLLDIFEEYPIQQLIIHARVREDYYKNTPHWETFCEAAKKCKLPLTYNGDVCTIADYMKIKQELPFLKSVMIGRGLLFSPSLAREILGGTFMNLKEFKAFHDEICQEYEAYMSGEKNTLFKMKELWSYWEKLFPQEIKRIKKIKKANSLQNYRMEVENLLDSEY